MVLPFPLPRFQSPRTWNVRVHRRNNPYSHRDRERPVPQLLGWGTNNVLVPLNFLAVVFKKQEISQQVVTRMQDLASEFSKIFRGWYPRTLTAGGGDPFPHPTPAPVLGPKPWSPSTFQRWLRPCPSQFYRLGSGRNVLHTFYFNWIARWVRSGVSTVVM